MIGFPGALCTHVCLAGRGASFFFSNRSIFNSKQKVSPSNPYLSPMQAAVRNLQHVVGRQQEADHIPHVPLCYREGAQRSTVPA